MNGILARGEATHVQSASHHLVPHLGEHAGRRIAFLAITLVPLVAFLVRAYRLDAQSLWYDEALSLHYARLPWLDLSRSVAHSDHPPLYFLALSAWTRLVGTSEWAVRFLSLAGGVLTVPLTARLARDLRWPGALGAATGVALSPFLIWYSQEARAYTWFTVAVLVSSLLLVRAMRNGRPSRWFAHALSVAVLLHLHYYSAFVLAAHALYALVASYKKSVSGVQGRAAPFGRLQAPLGQFAVSMLGGLLLFLPWALRAIPQLLRNHTYWQGAFPASQALVIFFRAAATAPAVPGGPWRELTTLAFLTLVLMGLVSLARLRADRLLVLALLLVPLVGIVGLVWRVPKFAPRYLVATLPLFFMLVSAALATPRRPALRLLAFSLLSLWGWGAARALWHLYFDPSVARPDMRSAAAYVTAHSQPGDAVLVVAGYNAPTFAYYNRAGLPVYALPETLLPDTRHPLDGVQVARTLNAIASRHLRLWLVLWQEEVVDPQRLVVDQLVSNALRLPVGETFHGVSLLLFSLEGASFAPTPPVEHHVGATFGEIIELVGYDLSRGGWARDTRQTQRRQGREVGLDRRAASFRPGETLYLALHWRIRQPVATDYVVSAQLLSPRNHIYGQLDRPVGGDRYPVSRWAVGQRVRQEHPLAVLPGTPPGEYTLVVAVYDPCTGERLPVRGPGGDKLGDALPLRTLQVPDVPTPPEAVTDIAHRLDVRAAGIRLVGYTPEAEAVYPPAAWRFTFFWQRETAAEEMLPSALELRLVGEGGAVALAWQAPLVEGRYPPAAWPEAGIVRDVHDVFVPAGVKPGRYRLEVRWDSAMPWITLPQPLTVK